MINAKRAQYQGCCENEVQRGLITGSSLRMHPAILSAYPAGLYWSRDFNALLLEIVKLLNVELRIFIVSLFLRNDSPSKSAKRERVSPSSVCEKQQRRRRTNGTEDFVSAPGYKRGRNGFITWELLKVITGYMSETELLLLLLPERPFKMFQNKPKSQSKPKKYRARKGQRLFIFIL